MTLWTPGGDADRPPRRPEADPDPGPAGVAPPAGDLDPEQAAQAEAMATEMAEVRRQLASVPASMVVANHVMGLYELAAIHLGASPPRLDDARLAIDAVAALLDALPGRLGDDETTLREALDQLRLAFVQIRSGDQEPGDPDTGGGEPPS
ncbi:hypothetical protein BH20ACT2_BH20ACT2_11060 [soil metagenome]